MSDLLICILLCKNISFEQQTEITQKGGLIKKMSAGWIEDYKKCVKPADILLIGGRGFIAKLICFGQSIQTEDGRPSLWSHCAFAVDKDTIIESTIDLEKFKGGSRLQNGVRYAPIETFKNCKRAMLISLPITDKQRYQIIEVADRKEKQGITYPVMGLLGSLLSFWVFRWQSNPLQTKNSLYCSAFIQETIQEVIPDVDFDPKHTARNTSPEMIYQYNIPGIKKIPLLE